jgi:hypothetical protein
MVPYPQHVLAAIAGYASVRVSDFPAWLIVSALGAVAFAIVAIVVVSLSQKRSPRIICGRFLLEFVADPTPESPQEQRR